MDNLIKSAFEESIQVKRDSLELLAQPLTLAIQKILTCLHDGHKVLICGNGGSAADAQHFAAELVNRFEANRKALPAIALTTDSSILTSVANDFHYDHVFSRQIAALGQPNDLLICISTSGNSPSIINAIKQAHDSNISTLLLTGDNGGQAKPVMLSTDVTLNVASQRTARIQETHLLLIHILCEFIDKEFT